MRKLLTLKHWQLFTLLVGLLILPILIFIPLVVLGNSFKIVAVLLLLLAPFIMMSSVWIFLGWMYTMGINLHKSLPPEVTMNLKRFKIAYLISLLYMLLRAFFEMCRFLDVFSQSKDNWVLLLGTFFSLFSGLCIFHCMYFCAKALRAVEWQAPVIFSDFAGDFISILFFPIGVWEIQPRINRLFASKNGSKEFTGVAGQV